MYSELGIIFVEVVGREPGCFGLFEKKERRVLDRGNGRESRKPTSRKETTRFGDAGQLKRDYVGCEGAKG